MFVPVSVVVLVATLVIFAVFFFAPILSTVKVAFFVDGNFTLDYIREVFANPIYREGLANSFWLAVWSTALSFALALPLAVAAGKYSFPGKKILGSLILVPLILPPFVGAIGVKQILGQQGALNAFLSNFGFVDMSDPVDWLGGGRFWGVAIMNALHLYPILFLNVSAALANIDPAMEEAASGLGCKPFRRFWRVTFPLAMPGVFAGATIVFIWSFTELGVPLIFDYRRVTSVQIFDGIKDLSGNPFPYALVVVLLVASVILYLIGKFAFGRNAYAMTGRAAVGSGERTLSPAKGLLCTTGFVIVFILAVIPHIGVAFTAVATDWYRTILPEGFTLQHFNDALGHELTVPSIANSLKYASVATLLDIILGIGIAYIVVRTKLPGRKALDTIAMLPLAVPGLVLAFGYLAMTMEGQPLHWLVPNGNPVFLLIVAYAIRRLPYVVRSAVAGFQQTSVSLEEAAQNLGATPARALRRVTIPLIAANLIAGGLLAFAFAMLEVSDSLILAQQQEHFPITKAIYMLTSALGNGHYLSAALGLWAMLFLLVTIVAATMAIGKKLGALFRV